MAQGVGVYLKVRPWSGGDFRAAGGRAGPLPGSCLGLWPARWTNTVAARLFRKTDYLGGSLDLALLALICVAVGLHLVAHVTLVIGLCLRDPWWRGLVALLVPPLAPFWGYEARLRRRVTLWVVTLVVYLASVITAAL